MMQDTLWVTATAVAARSPRIYFTAWWSARQGVGRRKAGALLGLCSLDQCKLQLRCAWLLRSAAPAVGKVDPPLAAATRAHRSRAPRTARKLDSVHHIQLSQNVCRG